MTESIRLLGAAGRKSGVFDWGMLLFWPVYGLAFLILERAIPGRSYHIMYHPLDNQIPFLEWFVIPYVFWYLYMTISVVYPLFREREAYRRVMEFYMIVFGVSTLIFFLYPTCQNLRPVAFPRENLLTEVVAVLYSMDTSTNVCPSLHVSGGIGAALGLMDTKRFSGKGWQIFHVIAAGSICLSTVFLKQHSVWDVFWGLVVSWMAWRIVYKK